VNFTDHTGVSIQNAFYWKTSWGHKKPYAELLLEDIMGTKRVSFSEAGVHRKFGMQIQKDYHYL